MAEEKNINELVKKIIGVRIWEMSFMKLVIVLKKN